MVSWLTDQEIWDSIPDDDRYEISAVIDAWKDDLDCMDNVRVARMGNEAHEAAYERARDCGCCGFMDIIKMCSSARQYRIGCNYGH